MAVSTYDSKVIIDRIIANLKLDTDIFDADGKDEKISTILFGDPPGQKWLAQDRPYIAVAPGEPFELSDEPVFVAKQGEESPKSRITLQFFITCVVDGSLIEDTLATDLAFRKLLKEFFKNNPKMKKTDGTDPLFHKSRTTITPKFIRNKSDIVSAFTVILQAELMSA
ncbi:MAG: hypothetical protein IIC67_07440 [Thaumarchaeota archaeon]|nr:hypothetical protein [Nitrososphaerota archaeon]